MEMRGCPANLGLTKRRGEGKRVGGRERRKGGEGERGGWEKEGDGGEVSGKSIKLLTN